MSILWCVPMIHTLREFGSLKNTFLATETKTCGEKATSEFLGEVERYWQEVEERIEQAGLYRPEIASRLHIFIDGLPNTEAAIVKKIVRTLTRQKIPVYLIVKKLQENGAVIHGTEEPRLLLQEHRRWTEFSQGKPQNPAMAQKLLRDRDIAIAKRIDTMLPDKEFGLLFIGRAHDVISEVNKLSREFEILCL